MGELIKIIDHVERRTYLKGTFRGKFAGQLDQLRSDNVHENFYDLEVLSGEATVNKSDLFPWIEGEPREFQNVERFLTKLPESIKCTLIIPDEPAQYFNINLNEAKLSGFILTNQTYADDRVLGDIIGTISGFLLHYEVEEKYVEGAESDRPSGKVKTTRPTSAKQARGRYTRHQYSYNDGSVYWGKWKFQTESRGGLSVVAIFLKGLQIAMFLLIGIPLFVAGWSAIWPFLLMVGIYMLIGVIPDLISFIWRRFMGLVALAFVVLFAISVLRAIPTLVTARTNDSKEPIVEEKTSEGHPIHPPDQVIRHRRIWTGYNGITYSGNLSVFVSDVSDANTFRNRSLVPEQSESPYNLLVSRLHTFDRSKLSLTYEMLDSLNLANSFDRLQFAEAIFSCIQQIPYTLILDGPCDANAYSDEFTVNFLQSGGPCKDFTTYGILSPVEFLATLQGDCDTRSLLLFTILDHYGFDVVMLGSQLYGHSVVGINLPLHGIFKMVHGKRYVVWETTAANIRPGMFPPEISEMRFWDVNLMSNQISI